MVVEYERDLRHNYMIIKEQEPIDENYQIRILGETKIQGVLPLEVRFVNGQAELYYDISGKQKLSDWLKTKKVNYEILCGIVKSLLAAFEEGMDYLLDCGCFLMEAEYMFVDIEKYEVSLCYYPGNESDIIVSGQGFLQYLLEMLDYSDKQAVEAAYELFRLCMRNGFGIDLLRDFLGEKEEVEEAETDIPDMEWKSVVPVSVMDEEEFDAMEEFCFVPLNMNLRMLGVGIIIGVWLLFLAIVWVLFKRSVTAWIMWALFSLIAIAVVLGLTVFYSRIIQYSRLVNVKRRIPYEEEQPDSYDDRSEEMETQGKKTTGDTEETVLLGYYVHNKACKRLVYMGEDIKKEIVITKNPFVVGKAQKDTDYCLDYPFVSRRHFMIEEEAGEYYITDTNSRNGLILNDETLTANKRTKLEIGDIIRIGDLAFLFR